MTLDATAIRAGTTSVTILLHARVNVDGDGKVGLRADDLGATAAYVRQGDGHAIRIPIATGVAGRYVRGGFAEIDPELAPGIYEFGLPDEAVAKGVARVVVVVRFPGATIEPLDVELVGYDPQDAVRLGLGAISPQARIEALRGAFPLLTRRELEEHAASDESG